MQGIQAVGDADAVGRAAVGGEFGFEGIHLGPQDVVATGQNALHRGINLGLQAPGSRLSGQERERSFRLPAPLIKLA